MHVTVDLSGLQHGLWYVVKRFVEAVGLCYLIRSHSRHKLPIAFQTTQFALLG